MEENAKTKLTLTHSGVTMTWEGPWDADLNDILDGLVGCLRGVTFGEWIGEGIKNWLEDRYDELFEIPEEEKEA